jgi:hypothetical protein
MLCAARAFFIHPLGDRHTILYMLGEDWEKWQEKEGFQPDFL